MSTTATRPTWKPHSHAHSHSHSRPSHNRAATTPRGAPPSSVGQNMPPFLSSHGPSPPPSHDPRTPSPSYFGFVVPEASNSPDSNPGQHTRQNWEYPSSQARSAAPTARTISAEANPEYELFRRQSDLNRFNLSSGNFSALNRPPNSRQTSKAKSIVRQNVDSPVSPHTIQPSNVSQKNDHKVGRVDLEHASFQISRHDSPAAMSPALRAVGDSHHGRLSLPSIAYPAPVEISRRVQRADTLPPPADQNAPTMISAQQLKELLASTPHETLLLDLRVYPQFSSSRLKGALNLCIPTTLLKRPSFNIQKLEDTFGTDEEREEFGKWEHCKYIVVYDANSVHLKEAITPINVLKKFSAEGWKGNGLIIKGGFAEVARTIPTLVDRGQAGQPGKSTKQALSLAPPALGAAPVAGGCPMPTSKSAANPFFGNIRQNMDLLDGVGQIPIKYPEGTSEQSKQSLPAWLRQTSNVKNEGKIVSERFLAIERSEQKRMQEALSGHVSYGSPRGEAPKAVQVAGIEKGSKNRYNNIFPYDHSRVRLQNVSSDGCDYVNANYVKAAYSNKRYIATQAPIPSTFNDFWRVVWEQDVRVIVMLTAESEGGQLKSHPYWHTADYGPLKLKNLSEKRVSLESGSDTSQNASLKRPGLGQRRSTNPHTKDEKSSSKSPTSDSPSVVVRHFTLGHSSYPFQPIREITQLHYSHWPDFGAPADPTHLLNLIELTNKYVRASSNSSFAMGVNDPAPASQRPVVVHCSAGCGRTGTFCTVDSVIDMLKMQRFERSGRDSEKMDVDTQDDWVNRDDVDLVAKTVEDFRAQRLSMVQNLRQFVLCYESVLQWLSGKQSEGIGMRKEGTRHSTLG